MNNVKKGKHTSQPIVQGSPIPFQNQQCQRNHQSLCKNPIFGHDIRASESSRETKFVAPEK